MDNQDSKKEKFESINIRLTHNRSWREKVFAQTIVLVDTGSFLSIFFFMFLQVDTGLFMSVLS